MIITLDTGILVRATVRSNGPARVVLQRIANDPSHLLAIAPFILAEVGRVLSYSPVQQMLQIAPEEVHRHLDYLRSIASVVEPQIGLPVVLNDPKDDPVVYTAVGSGANVLYPGPRVL